MAAGTSFVCGKCRNVLEVPQAGPVVQPISPAAGGGPAKGSMKPPPTVSMTPDQVRKALKESAAVGAERTTPPAQPQQQRTTLSVTDPVSTQRRTGRQHFLDNDEAL